ncbi:hypothetical protein [Paenibacillus sp. 453mf]|uniref:hypothetical protein n=1 Tax=Paenibacillus sp. 453mf TaxID=1761874 RepID=UPI000B89D1E0|nr:hypothetical protein [Paenibacillus sp. 453mf]
MKRIIFTNHANIRCKQQGINPESLKYELRDVPKFNGEVRWITAHAIVKLESKGKNIAIVKTVISKRKYKDSRKLNTEA